MPHHFPVGRLSLGVAEPLTNDGPVPDMSVDAERAVLAEEVGFDTLWFRDVPLLCYEFRDAGQIYDPFVYMSFIAARTRRIGLATGSTILTLRHPIHVAKQAASLDLLSGGRVALGVATGDREEEFPAFKQKRSQRQRSFADAVSYIRALWQPGTPMTTANRWGAVDMGVEMLPKPAGGEPIPLIITGHCRQSPEWIAKHGDGWLFYPQDQDRTAAHVRTFRELTKAAGRQPQPYLTQLSVDLLADADAPAKPLRHGFRAGRRFLIAYLREMEQAGVDHMVINLRSCRGRPIPEVLQEFGEHILPHFPTVND
ncbi:TIGR03571 family LLM class oxidoreductase [Corynebacterium sp. TAE3-ERU12]|uniref:TIGR03571 family LLM class oxidoreductase n=1 Tax=Corynebacterium sp. TAE3-ERU12 TaxID=2849491 RepID=UPI001C44AC42|nr:TIGR03571 family LLM class oxidoreductase [Corynebacterium sp. TAE3-ERU12]MBV7295261.1 TIGR03571 family LLM class oxidoreductase [Corynebacterium sp. TAE3-ERU12]